jgi:hypothetical protein
VVSLESSSPRGESHCAELLRTGELKEKLADKFQERFRLEDAQKWIVEGFEEDRSKSWRGDLDEMLDEPYKAEHEDKLHDAGRRYVRKRLGEREVERQGDRKTREGGGG